MSNNNDYWFLGYDSEFEKKTFSQVNFKRYDSLVVSLPSFKDIPKDYALSNNPFEYELQVNVANIIGELMNFFQPNNPDIYSNEKLWIDFVIRSQLFLNCEKYYCLIFWKFNFNNQFTLKRLMAFFVRFFKFLEAFQQAIFKQEAHRKTKSLTQAKDQVHVKINGLTELIQNLYIQVQYAINANKQLNAQPYNETLLFENLSQFLMSFQLYSFDRLQMFVKNSEQINIYSEVLRSNQVAKKSLDNLLSKYEKENEQSFAQEKKALETSYSKVIMDEYEKRFMPQETEASEDRFWETFEQYKQKNKKTTHVSGLTTNRDYTTQTSLVSMNTEATDDVLFDSIDDKNSFSITRSLMSQKEYTVGNQQPQIQSYIESNIFKDSPHYPNLQKNPMMQFLVPEVSEFCKNNSKSTKQNAQANSVHKMKFGNESKRDIEKALKKKNNKQNQNTINEQDEENYDEDQGAEDMEDEEGEQEDSDYDENNDQNNPYITYSNKNNEINMETMDYVKNANQSLVQIRDQDIDFDQNKTKGLQLKRADDVSGNRYKTQSNSEIKHSASNSNLENVQNPENNTIENDGMDDENEEQDPQETPQNEHFGEFGQEFKDDDIFDYSYEKDDDDDDDTENNNSQQDNDSDNDDNDSIDELRRESVADKDKVKLKVPFTQFKSQIENSFIQFLKESLYTQDNDMDIHLQDNMQSSSIAQNQQKKKTKVSLKSIFPDIRVININGYAQYSPHFNECWWMYIRKRVQNRLIGYRVNKINRFFFTVLGIEQGDIQVVIEEPKDLTYSAPSLKRKKLNACEQKQINY